MNVLTDCVHLEDVAVGFREAPVPGNLQAQDTSDLRRENLLVNKGSPRQRQIGMDQPRFAIDIGAYWECPMIVQGLFFRRGRILPEPAVVLAFRSVLDRHWACVDHRVDPARKLLVAAFTKCSTGS